MLIDIAEVARKSGVPASTLRFYEERGLIEALGRRGLRRTFEPAVLDRLALIALGRSAGFTLEDIAGMLSVDGRLTIDRDRIGAKADELDATARRLKAVGEALRHVAACPAPNHLACPTFRRLMKVAASDQARQRRPRRRAQAVGARDLAH